MTRLLKIALVLVGVSLAGAGTASAQSCYGNGWGSGYSGGWGSGYSGGWGSGYSGGFGGRSLYNGGYGGGYGPTWHDTSHLHYHGPSLQRHGNHYHYIPAHTHLHRSGHWHY